MCEGRQRCTPGSKRTGSTVRDGGKEVPRKVEGFTGFTLHTPNCRALSVTELGRRFCKKGILPFFNHTRVVAEKRGKG